MKIITFPPFRLSLSQATIARGMRFDKLTANGNDFSETNY